MSVSPNSLRLPTEPPSDLEGGEVVRPDRNLEKWPIWEPSNSRQKPRTRTLRRQVRLPDGSKATATVEVGYSDKGLLTTEDQKTLYALVKLWEERGRPTEFIHFSKQQLAKILRKSWGQKVNMALTGSLMRLRFTPFTWEHSYYDNTARETVGRIDTFTVLSELHLVYRKTDGSGTTEACYFQFNERILTNLLTHYTRPVFLDTVLGFKSEIAQILYSYLDLVLYDKNHFERCTQELFKELGMDGPAYRYRSKRAQVLEPALRELEGKPLPTGVLKEVRLEKTKDDTDFKIVVRKARGRPAKRGESPETPPEKRDSPFLALGSEGVVSSTPQAGATPPPPVLPAPSDAEGAIEQVRHFYQIFFKSGQIVHPTPKELSHAQDHLARLGEEKARYLVTFALREARLTQFAIQTYGGICQYEGRAMSEYEEHHRKRSQALRAKARRSHEDRCRATYLDYLGERYAKSEKRASPSFAAFLAEEEEGAKRFSTGKLADHPTMKRVLNDYRREEARLGRFTEYFKADSEEPVLEFWEWDETLNPDRFAL